MLRPHPLPYATVWKIEDLASGVNSVRESAEKDRDRLIGNSGDTSGAGWERLHGQVEKREREVLAKAPRKLAITAALLEKRRIDSRELTRAWASTDQPAD